MELTMPGENELSAAGRVLFEQIKAIRDDMKTMTTELQKVSEYIIQFRTQNVADRLTKLEEGRIRELESRVTRQEQFQARLIAIFATIQVVGLLVSGLVGWYLAWKK